MKVRKTRREAKRVGELLTRMGAAPEEPSRTLQVKLARSAIGGTERQRATLRCLGLGKRGSQALVPDTAQTRGRIRAVAHLVEVEEAK